MIWLGLLGALLAGYLVLDGYTFGVGMLRPWLGRDDGERRLLLNAVGPYFLGNEVWIVATAGVLFGVFPELEGSLLAGFYPLFVLVAGSLIVRDGGIWFRGLRRSPHWRRTWDLLTAFASAGLALGWGLILGNLLEGVPTGHSAPLGAGLFDPYALLCGITFAVLAACHGATFLAARTTEPHAPRAAHVARTLTAPSAVLLAAAAGLGFAAGGVRTAIDQPVIAVLPTLGAAVAIVATRRCVTARRYGLAFTGSAVATGLPVLAVGAGMAPDLTATLSASATLSVLGSFLLAMLPVMAAGQIWLWWTFRGRVGPETPMYF